MASVTKPNYYKQNYGFDTLLCQVKNMKSFEKKNQNGKKIEFTEFIKDSRHLTLHRRQCSLDAVSNAVQV